MCSVCVQHNRAGSGVVHNSLIWHRRPVKPAKQEQVKEGLPVIQSSMHWPPFRHGRRCGHTDTAERGQCERNPKHKDSHDLLEPGLTGVITAPDFYICIIDTEDPSARVAHVGSSLNVHHIRRTRAGDVEIALAITSIETCLEREYKGGRYHKKLIN